VIPHVPWHSGGGVAPSAPRHLADRVSNPSEPFYYLDIGKMLDEGLRHRSSHRYTGLQIADVIATVVRRACNETLQPAGWANLGKLMVERPYRQPSLRVLQLEDLSALWTSPSCAAVQTRLQRDCKRMLTRATHA
jgi:hypothetical protein